METIQQLGKRLRKAFQDADCGPMLVAADVLDVAARWETDYKKDAGGKTCGAWLSSVLGRGRTLKWFGTIARAVERIGEASRATWHYRAAVWASENIKSPVDLRRLDEIVQRETAYVRPNVLSVYAVRRLAYKHKIVTHRPAAKVECLRCKVLERKLAELGVQATG